MRGSPLFRAAFMAVALLVLIFPLRSFTAPRSAAPAAPTVAAPATPVRLQLTSTATPITFAVSHLGKVIWQGDAAASPVETTVALAFPAEGVDLGLSAKWTPGRTAAVKLGVARGEDDPATQTVWGDGAIDEVLTFK